MTFCSMRVQQPVRTAPERAKRPAGAVKSPVRTRVPVPYVASSIVQEQPALALGRPGGRTPRPGRLAVRGNEGERIGDHVERTAPCGNSSAPDGCDSQTINVVVWWRRPRHSGGASSASSLEGAQAIAKRDVDGRAVRWFSNRAPRDGSKAYTRRIRSGEWRFRRIFQARFEWRTLQRF
jgi:hypothetical protein